MKKSIRYLSEEIQKYRMKDPDSTQNGCKLSGRTAELIGQGNLQNDGLLLRLYHVFGRLIGEDEEKVR